jgi:hypothetical protein
MSTVLRNGSVASRGFQVPTKGIGHHLIEPDLSLRTPDGLAQQNVVRRYTDFTSKDPTFKKSEVINKELNKNNPHCMARCIANLL